MMRVRKDMGQSKRIPSILRNFTGPDAVRKILSFLTFEEWLEREGNQASDWIIVACSRRDENSWFFTFSVLASTQDDNLEKLLEKPDWEVDSDLGQPSLYSREGKTHYNSGTRTVVNNIEFRPFTIFRSFHDYVPATFELVQEFLLYHRAYLSHEEGEYRRVTNDGDMLPVARIRLDDDSPTLLVDAHHLRDYLAAKKCCLVRYHNHSRNVPEDIREYLAGDSERDLLSDESSCFRLWLGRPPATGEAKGVSNLHGKDLVLPYPEPDREHTWFVTEREDREFVDFIIDRDDHGEHVELTCNATYATGKFLTPVYFQREVLNKYYDEPSRYGVSESDVKCLDLWRLPIDVNEEDLVYVWLGDLGQIPFKEQFHWRQYNVPPRGGITRHRFLQDIEGKFADPQDPIVYFRVAFDDVQRATKEKYGEGLFRDLDAKDRHLYGTLRLPLTEEWREFDEQIQGLAKAIVDSLNTAFLSRETGHTIDGETVRGSIDLLETYLSKVGLPDDLKQAVIRPFRAVWGIRSAGVAHRKGSNFNRALRRLQLDKLSNRAKIRKLVTDLTDALLIIARTVHELGTE